MDEQQTSWDAEADGPVYSEGEASVAESYADDTDSYDEPDSEEITSDKGNISLTDDGDVEISDEFFPRIDFRILLVEILGSERSHRLHPDPVQKCGVKLLFLLAFFPCSDPDNGILGELGTDIAKPHGATLRTRNEHFLMLFFTEIKCHHDGIPPYRIIYSRPSKWPRRLP